jgi:hypothetical protein
MPAEMLGWSYPDVLPYDDIRWQAARCLGARPTGAFIGREGLDVWGVASHNPDGAHPNFLSIDR